jgi:integrase
MVLHYADEIAPTNNHDLVFPTSTGKWQSITNWRKLGFGALCREAGLVESAEVNGRIVERSKYSPYDLRHFYASMLIEQRVNLKRIQTLMGHSNISTTLNVYGHLIERAEIGKSESQGLMHRMRTNQENPCGKSVASRL